MQLSPVAALDVPSLHAQLRKNPHEGPAQTCLVAPSTGWTLYLRSRPPFTGVLLGPGPESAPRSAFWAILGTCLGVPQRVLFECFLAFFGPKNDKKHSKSTLWGTPRQVPKIAQKALRGALSGPGPKSTPVNGGRDRNAILSLLHPLDRYRTSSAIGSAIGRPLSFPISHPNTGGSPQPPRSKPLGGLNRGMVVLQCLKSLSNKRETKMQ